MFSTIQPKELQDKAVLAVAISNSSHIFLLTEVMEGIMFMLLSMLTM